MRISVYGSPDQFFEDAFFNASGLNANVTSLTSTQVVVENGGAVTTFNGTGFSQSGGEVTGGTINNVVFRQNGTVVARITGLTWDAVDFVAALDAIDSRGDFSGLDALLSSSGWVIYDVTGRTSGEEDELNHILVPVTFLGSAFGDRFSATAQNDDLQGNGGNDVLRGLGGADLLSGGAGRDNLWGGSGNDTVFGNAGADTIGAGAGSDVVWAGTDNDLVYGGTGNDVIGGGAGNDKLWSNGDNDTVYGGGDDDLIGGGQGDDRLWANQGDDTIYGAAGNDVLGGGAGADYLSGGDDDDTIYGGAGDDTLVNTGSGRDTMAGGDGADTFVFRGTATGGRVLDFEDDIDTLKLDDALWGGGLSASQMVYTYGVVSGNSVVLTFDSGDSITVTGVNRAELIDDITIV